VAGVGVQRQAQCSIARSPEPSPWLHVRPGCRCWDDTSADMDMAMTSNSDNCQDRNLRV
jgi:hypothetical protein